MDPEKYKIIHNNIKTLSNKYLKFIGKNLLEHNLSAICNPFVLAAFIRANGRFITQKEIAEKAGITQPAVAHAVDKMVKAGILERGKDEEDRRRYHISVTQKGRKSFEEYLAAGVNFLPHIFKGIENDDLSVFYLCSKKIIENLEDLSSKT
ncbi:MAG: MarR family transcriptional regulator [Treponema sp.]|nr:MarR family transcriptional regulator [Treponema sp.]